MKLPSRRARILLLLASLVVIAAVSVVTVARIKNRVYAAGLDFAAYGDCRHRPQIHTAVCKSMLAAAPKFVIMTGDLVDLAEREDQWAVWMETTRELRSRSKFYVAAGNHDLGAENLFQKNLGIDRLTFDRREGDLHLFILNSNDRFTDPTQLQWLEKTAQASTARHKFAVFHHPPFLIDNKHGPEFLEMRAVIHPLLARLKFCAAFCGHQHGYYNTVRDGVRYIVTAGGGAPLWDLDASLGLPADKSRKFHHFTGFKFEGSKILGHVYDRDGLEDLDLAFTLCDHP